jgi:Mg-chelatase subunit ChlI
MEERQVTIEGTSRRLPEPFFVIATQNPAHQLGVFALPESQLDRFLMRLSVGYPPPAAERALLTEPERRELIAEAENYAADQEASQTRKLYAAYTESIQQMRQALGISSSNEPYLLDFLNQQKWASAYQKNQQGQNTFVLNNTASAVPMTLPAPAGSQPQPAPGKRDATTTKN